MININTWKCCDFDRQKCVLKRLRQRTTDEAWEEYATTMNGLNLMQAFYKKDTRKPHIYGKM